ncbi:bifunctional diguanylate cyclase/phosphodiesterase [Comamonas terrigena]|uniref:Diguanylate cyclase n=1 Tax=Comamonas terrigena TaxID=32013 RepID=A0A2A7UZP5_COMTR|nr:LapD/MoxY N-terminal periplasmic domain-containing protein [Comamonas terrigena]PEH90738.1 diguanylate cyclase [Comamonas terrigena]BBL26139.1 diguanylate phosphodiesterase [Comamonas terrigena NBRC 13299]SUY70296.1 Regulator of CsrB and CsrC decay CsrD [Comamonas terrigena]
MSLLKRLLLTVSVAILIILSGTLALSIHAARQYLDGQLQSQSENAVSALALSLSQPANQDEVTRELLMMALFDSGQFRAISLTGTEGQTLFERSHPDTPGNGVAPPWFARLLPLRVPVAQRAISDGWKQVGNLSVTVDNTFARDALWSSSIRMGLLVLVAGGLWALSVVGLLSWFSRVLREEISAQVMAIGATASGATAPGAVAPLRSKVAELTDVVHAISDTRERVRATAQEQTQRIESLEVELNRDQVTMLPNRKYFMNELRRVLQGDVGADGQALPVGGHVLLFRQRDLQALNTYMTRAPADAWLAAMAERVGLRLAAEGPAGTLLARLNGSDFIVLMPGMEGPAAMHVVQQIKHDLQALRQPIGPGQWCRWAYALTDYDSGVTVSELLSRLDQGLRRSESVGQEEVEYLTDAAPRNTVSERQWQQTLVQALAEERLSLQVAAQNYAAASAAVQRHEASLTLQEADGALLQGALFLPVAVRLGMSATFDVRAMQLGLQWLQQHAGAQLVVKVSLPSLSDDSFLPQLRALWEQAADVRQRLWVELDAHGLVAYAEEVEALASAAAALGVHVGLRRLEHEPMALARLHLLPLAYVKLGSDFAQQATTSPGSQHLLQAMVATAQALQVEVYLAGSVDAETAQALQAQGVHVPVA